MKRMGWVISILLFLSSSFLPCKSEFFTSTADMMQLVQTGSEAIRSYKRYLQSENGLLETMKTSVREMEVVHNLSNITPDTFIENPLNSFLLIKRMTVDWPPLFFNDTKSRSFFRNMTSKRKGFLWPSEEDLSGAVTALNRLIRTYKLSTSELAQGKIDNFNAYKELSADDCLELGIRSSNNKDYHSAYLWMNEAWEKLQSSLEISKSNENILKDLTMTSDPSQSLDRSVSFQDKTLYMNPQNARAQEKLEKWKDDMENIKRKKGQTAEGFQKPREKDIMMKYRSLCRGETHISEAIRRKLRCYIQHGPSQYLKIRPVKVEVAHINPSLFVYHGIIADNEIKEIKRAASPKLRRSKVRTFSNIFVPANYRISKVSWLENTGHPIVRTVNERIELVTGLSMKSAEKLQVSNYGLGGHYEPHLDYPKKHADYPKRDLRIATFMFYLTDVKSGGATVFPKLGITIWPLKGSAAFWYNLLPNGDENPLTIHGACPVLIGQKWVANKWIREKGQAFRKPCNLHKNQDLFNET